MNIHIVKRHLSKGGNSLKLICKCGNIDELKTDRVMEGYKIRNNGDGTIVLICKKCNEVVIINIDNK